MEKILDSNIVVDDIVIEMDEDSATNFDNIFNTWGVNVPIIKIGDYVLPIGDLQTFDLFVAINSFPKVEMGIDDSLYNIRKALSADIDKCVIYYGYKHWYIKFNAILDTTYSEIGGSVIDVTGKLYVEGIYDTAQKAYNDVTVQDILSDILTTTSLGFVVDNNIDLSKTVDVSVQANDTYFEYFEKIIKTYTTNLYAIDPNYYVHVVDLEKLRTNSVDTYSLDWKTGESCDAKELLFRSKTRLTDDESDDDYILVNFFSIDTNFSDVHTKTKNVYNIKDNENETTILTSPDTIGIGTKNANTFSGFANQKFPYYKEIINKKLAGNIIKFNIDKILPELMLFNIINLELYTFDTDENIMVLQTEHSGKKIIISYTISYNKNDENRMHTTIEVI